MKDSPAAEPTIRIALIATYPEMTRMLLSMAKQENVMVTNIFASFEAAVEAAKRVEPQVEGILSRGGTGALIQQKVAVPVVSAPITPYDLLKTVEALEDRPTELAFSNYARNIYGVRDIEDRFGLRIHEYTFTNKEDIAGSVEDARKRGISVFIGGEVAKHLSIQAGMRGVEIVSGREAVYRSFQELLELIRTRREERFRAKRLETVMAVLSEGIVMTDEQMRVVVMNPSAKRLLRVTAADIETKGAEELLPNIGLETAAAERKQVCDHLEIINERTVNISHYPVQLGAKFIGVASTFEDVTRIQQLEGKIRKKLYSRGFVARRTFDDIQTSSAAMRDVKQLATIYAGTRSSVLIQGESGTGKELFAQSIHVETVCLMSKVEGK